MNKKQIIIYGSIGLTFAGLAAFAFKSYISYKKEKELNDSLYDELDKSSAIIDETIASDKLVIDELSEEIDALKKQLYNVTFSSVDENGSIIEDPEMAEMKKRFNKTEEPEQKETAKIHNLFTNGPVDLPNGEDIEVSKIVEAPGFTNAEEGGMRYPMNSKEALEAFIDLKLSDYLLETDDTIHATLSLYHFDEYMPSIDFLDNSKENVLRALRSLFNYRLPYTANEFDENVVVDIMEERIKFFTDKSIYSDYPTVAEFIIQWANRLSFDMDGSPLAYAAYILFQLNYWIAKDEGEFITNVDNMMSHHLLNNFVINGQEMTTTGIFGLQEGEDGHIITGANVRFINEYNSLLVRMSNIIDEISENSIHNE